jgi:hypothetical protein
MAVNNDAYVTLEHAFNETFVTSNYKNCLLSIGMNTPTGHTMLFQR